MRKTMLSVVILLFLSYPVLADHPATVFYVVKAQKLEQIVPKEGTVADIDEDKLEDICTTKGYFKGNCSIYLKTRDYQHRIKAFPSEHFLEFEFRMYSQKEKKEVWNDIINRPRRVWNKSKLGDIK